MKRDPAKDLAPAPSDQFERATMIARSAATARPWGGIARAAAIGLLLAVAGCANAIDVICPPAGQCPNVRSGHGGGY